MKKLVFAALAVLVVAAVAGGYASARGEGKSHFKTRLDGWQEVPSQVTTGFGSFRARVVNSDTIEFWLTYSGLEGDATQAHIHIGSHHENGSVSAWLCGAGGTAQPACPLRAGEVHWFIERNDIAGTAAGQGVEAGNMEDLLRAMRHDEVYVNVHTGRAPGGEIRGDFGHDRHH